ncbi:MAG: TetR/AcrR family transcriptional regulator [Ruminococcus sp.]|nr:TetR/AcrR family transcriptional regulator [Ruminococcus sp.]
MPKQRINKKMVIDTAFEIARKHGYETVTVGQIADTLGCSVQPVYSYCVSMDGLREELKHRVIEYFRREMTAKIDVNDFYLSTAHALMGLAVNETNLFKLFIYSQRDNIKTVKDFYGLLADASLSRIAAAKFHLNPDAEHMMHSSIAVFTYGMCLMLVTTQITFEEANALLQTTYESLLQTAKRMV